MQLRAYAKHAGVSVSEIKRWLRESPFASGDRHYKSPDTELTREEVQALDTARAAGELRRDTGGDVGSGVHDIVDAVVTSADIDHLQGVQVAALDGAPRAQGAYGVYVHQEVLEWLDAPDGRHEQRRVFTRRVQELMAHGRSARMKGTKGANAGWVRTPLGGNGGFQYYLWLTNAGESVRRQQDATSALHATAPAGSRFLRAIRHHDETSVALDVGRREDYLLLAADQALAANSDGLLEPLLESQSAAAHDRRRVRLLVGQPGAGKTTTLQAAASRLAGRALYVTWSHYLAARAREWFATFAPNDLDVVVWTFRELLAHVDPNRAVGDDPSLPVAVDRLCDQLKPYAGQLGPWRRDGRIRAEELFAELHAHYVGAALPVSFRERRASSTGYVADEDYRSLRHQLGAPAQDGVLLAWSKLADADRRALFPGVMAAFDRALGLQRGDLVLDPELFSFDWVLVDEVQDLTLTEEWLLLDVTARSGRERSVKPGMIIAGDEAQTVRPTAFEFGPLADLVDLRLDGRLDRKDHHLTANLRSPEAIARLLDRARDALYKMLPRAQRPGGSRFDGPADVTVGRVMLVESPNEHLADVFRLFAKNPAECALVYPGAQIPAHIARLAAELSAPVWTSESIKGLEFRVVGVLDVPAEVTRIERLAECAAQDPLALELARYSVDRFIVACSRSTETLVLLGDSWEGQSSPMLRCFMGDQMTADDTRDDVDEADEGFMGVVSPATLGAVLEVDAADAVMQVDSLLEQSERRSELGEHAAAVSLARNAVGLLGRAGRPGSAGPERRRKTHARLGRALALEALVERRYEALLAASRALRSAEMPALAASLTAVRHVMTKDLADSDVSKRLAELATALRDIARSEPRLAAPIVNALLERVSTLAADDGEMPSTRGGRAAALGALHELSSHAPSAREGFRTYRQAFLHRCLHHIAGHRDKASTEEYAHLRGFLDDPIVGALFDAERDELHGDYVSAAHHWEAADRPSDALRCARAAGELATAERLAAELKHEDASNLRWARDVLELLAARPAGSLTAAERDVLVGSLQRALTDQPASMARAV